MPGPAASGPPGRLALVLLGLGVLCLFADQNLMAPNLSAIARDLGLDPVERDVKLGGDISLVFWLLGGTVSLAVGALTDRLPRRRLFAAVLLIGELPCLLTAFAATYEQLFWLRALTGLGVGGAIPLCYSLLGDLVPSERRARASAALGLMSGPGIALGQGIAGGLGPTQGWRLPFILVAVPGLVVGLAFLLLVQEPARGAAEDELRGLRERGEDYRVRLDLRAWLAIFRVRTNVLVFLQGIPGMVPWGVFFVFLNDYLAQDRGLDVGAATLLIMTVGAASIVGGFGGGLVGNALFNRRPALLPLLCGVAAIVGVVPTLLLLHYPSQVGVAEPELGPAFAIAAITGLIVAIPSANVRAILLDVNPPETRGSVFSLFNLADDLGKGFGPVIIAALIARLGRATAFDVAALFWVACGVVLLALVPAFPRDQAAMRALLRERAASQAR